MDDVILAGTSRSAPRPKPREVFLTIDNADRAPQPFRDTPVLEVVRRIDRGKGWTPIGEEVQAKGVQLLFADA